MAGNIYLCGRSRWTVLFAVYVAPQGL